MSLAAEVEHRPPQISINISNASPNRQLTGDSCHYFRGMYINFSLIGFDTDTGSPPSPRFNHQPQQHVGGYSAQPWSLPTPTATNEFTTLVGGPPLPRPSLFQPPTSCYDLLVVFFPSPGPRPPQPPPMSRYDSLVAHSLQPRSSPAPTATNGSL